MIRVCAQSATNLPDADWWPKDKRPDSYVRLSLIYPSGTTVAWSGASSAHDNSANPSWNLCANFDHWSLSPPWSPPSGPPPAAEFAPEYRDCTCAS